MPASKAQQKAVSKYMKENYDVYQIRMKKGQKDTIKAHAAAQGESTNAFIGRAISEAMERDAGGPQEPPATPAGSPPGTEWYPLPTDTIKAAQEAAKAAGEAVPVFIDRAVTTQAKRDVTARKLEGG